MRAHAFTTGHDVLLRLDISLSHVMEDVVCNLPRLMDLGELRPHEATTPQRVRKSTCTFDGAPCGPAWWSTPSTTSSSTGTTDWRWPVDLVSDAFRCPGDPSALQVERRGTHEPISHAEIVAYIRTHGGCRLEARSTTSAALM